MLTKMIIRITAFALALAAVSTPQMNRAANTIKISGIFSLTGDLSSIDLPANYGAMLAVEEINAAGGVLGLPLEYIARDTKFQLDVAAAIAQQVIAEDKPAAVIGANDADSILAIGPFLQDAQITLLSPGATSPKLPDQIGDYLFLACFGDNVQAAAAAEYGLKNVGKTAYVLTNRGIEYTKFLSSYFKAAYKSDGGTIIGEDVYDDQTKDFSAQVAKIKALPSQPDFYFISAMPYDAGLIAKAIRAAGLTSPIIGGDGYDTLDIIRDVGTPSPNIYFTTHAYMGAEDGTPTVRRFMAAYKKKYNRDAENVFAALGYDSIYLIADAIKRANSADPIKVKKALEETTKFAAVTGEINFKPDSHIPQKTVTIVKIIDGKFSFAAELSPASIPDPNIE